MKHCSHMLVVRQMPLLFQCMEDLDSLPKGKEDKGKDQQPGDEFPWTLVLHDCWSISQQLLIGTLLKPRRNTCNRPVEHRRHRMVGTHSRGRSTCHVDNTLVVPQMSGIDQGVQQSLVRIGFRSGRPELGHLKVCAVNTFRIIEIGARLLSTHSFNGVFLASRCVSPILGSRA